MHMIGVIILSALVLFIVICTCPGFLTFFFCVALPVGALVYYLVYKLRQKLNM